MSVHIVTNQPQDKIKLMKQAASYRIFSPKIEELCKPYNREGVNVLDIGMDGDVYPGGHLYLFDKATYETLDIEEELRPSYVCDIRETPFKDGSFQVVLFIATLEHIIKDREKAIKEVYRILAPNGLLIIVAPTVITEAEKAYAEPVTLKEIQEALPTVPMESELIDKDRTLFITIRKWQ